MTGQNGARRLTHATTCCISIAGRPSSFGMTIHNAAYEALGLDFVYKAFEVRDLAGAIAGVRALGIRGCGVSMPFKQEVIAHLDAIDPLASRTRSVNTIVNDAGRLTGYNTDVAGARVALATIGAGPADRVLVLGAGGAARAILVALWESGVREIVVAARGRERAEAALQGVVPCEIVSWESRDASQPSLIVNATSIGMAPLANEVPVGARLLEGARAIMDVVVTPRESRLILQARAAGKAVAPGHVMSLHQAAAQFALYTGQTAPLDVMRAALAGIAEA